MKKRKTSLQRKSSPSSSRSRKVQKLLRTLHQPKPRLLSYYERSILKSHNTSKQSRSSSASGKLVSQLREQKNSCPPLQVFPDVQYDPEIVTLYKEVADAHGMSIA
jgi:hypothetical protein